MIQSRNAVGNLIARYSAVLKRCTILNTFGTLAMAGALALSATAAMATTIDIAGGNNDLRGNTEGNSYAGPEDVNVGKTWINGGWDSLSVDDPNMSAVMDYANENSDFIVESGAFAEIIGGNNSVLPDSHPYEIFETTSSAFGTTKIVIKDAKGIKNLSYGLAPGVTSVIGGTKINDPLGTVANGATDVTIEGGIFGSNYSTISVVGGNILRTVTQGASTGTITGGTSLTITPQNEKTPVFLDTVVGGSLAERYVETPELPLYNKDDQNGLLSVTDDLTQIVIDGGQFLGMHEDTNANDNIEGDSALAFENVAVVGGGMALGSNTFSQVTGTASSTFNGGTFNGQIVGGGAATTNDRNYSTTEALKAESSVNAVSMTFNGGSFNDDVFGGGFADATKAAEGNSATATVNKINVAITDNDTVSPTFADNVYLGGSAANGATASVTGTGEDASNMTISGGSFEKNVYGGGLSDSTSTANVAENNISISGGSFAANTSTIYVGGNGAGSTVTEGTVTFTGDQASLQDPTAQGATLANGYAGLTVSGTGENGATVGTSTLAFENYDGTFQGNINSFDAINIDAESSVTLTALAIDDKVALSSASDMTVTDLTLSSGFDLTKKGAGILSATDLVTASGTLNIDEGSLKATNMTIDGTGFTLASGHVTTDKLTISDSATASITGATSNLSATETTWETGSNIGVLTVANQGTFNTGMSSVLTSSGDEDFTLNSQLGTTGAYGLAVEDGANLVLVRSTDYTQEELDNATAALSALGSEMVFSFTGGSLVDSSTGSDVEVNGTLGEGAADGAGTMNEVTNTTTNKLTVDASGAGAKDGGLTVATPSSGMSTANMTLKTDSSVNNVTLEVAGSMTLVASDGALVTADNGTDTAPTVKMNVGTGNTLNLGVANNTAKQTGSLDALDVAGGALKVEGTGSKETSYTVNNLALKGAGTMSVLNSSLVAEKLTMDAGTTAFIDPAYVRVTDTSTAINGALLVSEGSVLEAGSGAESIAIQNILANNGITAEVTGAGFTLPSANSALVITGTGMTISSTGQLIVDSNVDTSGKIGGSAVTDSAYFGEGSMIFVDAATLNGAAALTIEGTNGVTVNNSANSFYVLNAEMGDTTILDNTGAITFGTAWDGSETSVSSNFMLDQKLKANGGDIILTTAVATENFGVEDELFKGLTTVTEDGALVTNSGNTGGEFLAHATNKLIVGTAESAAKLINSAAYITVASGAAGVSTDTANMTSKAIKEHLESEKGLASTDYNAMGWSVWATPLYQQSDVNGMDAGSLSAGYESTVMGGLIGLEHKMQNCTFGFAMNVGTGDIDSQGDFTSTSNDMSYWGGSIYGGIDLSALHLTGDIGYTSFSHDAQQNISNLGLGSIGAEFDSEVYTLGINAAYSVPLSMATITPHIGLRYNAYSQDSVATNVFNVDEASMDTFFIPVGVAISGKYASAGWTITPELDLTYMAAFGDTDIDNKVSINGLQSFGTASLEADILDANTFGLGLGVDVTKGNWTLGLDLDAQLSDSRNSEAVFAKFCYRF